MAKQSLQHWLQTHAVAAARLHFVYAAIYFSAIVLFDAWNLITPETILERWLVGTLVFIGACLVWYAARQKSRHNTYYQGLIYGLVALDLAVATHGVYNQRGIASKSVLLYAIAIITAAFLLSRAAIFATAAISVALYGLVCVRYFYLNPGQAYKVELYGEVAFYGALLLLLAMLIWSLLKQK
jgi:hypothetical protein